VNTPNLRVERELFAAGFSWVIGVDEVGRGAIAGPVAVGMVAVGSDVSEFPAGLRDSKLLSEFQRQRLHPALKTWAKYHAIACVANDVVNDSGIVPSLGEAGAQAARDIIAAGVELALACVIVDGSHDWLSPALEVLPEKVRPRVVTRVKADRDCVSVAAASVLAKVHRDSLMIQADEHYPGYAWARNKGYATSEHYQAIARLGQSPLHRSSWIRAQN